MALYHTYRPQVFAEIVGQEHIIQTLKNSIVLNNISHAYLFAGPRGTGKTTVARILAKAANCLKRKEKDYEPCNKCTNCLAITAGKAMDLLEIDAASNRGIDEIRSLREKINYAATQLKYKVYIIDEVHMLTNEAFNALLKTLEEPPSFTLFILATTEVYRVPETVVSRCLRFDFRRIPTVSITELLEQVAKKEKITIDSTALRLIAKKSQGGLRDALGMLEQIHSYAGEVSQENVQHILGLADTMLLERFFDSLLQGDVSDVIDTIHQVVQEGHDIVQFTDALLEYLRQLLLYKTTANAALVEFSLEEEEKAKLYCQEWTTHQLLELAEIFLAAKNKFRMSPLPELPLELSSFTAIEYLRVPRNSTQAPIVKSLPQNVPLQGVPKETRKATSLPKEQPKKEGKTSEKVSDRKKPLLVLQEIIDKWGEILEKIRKYNHSLEALLRSFEPIRSEENRVTLRVQYNFHKEKLSEVPNKTILEQVFQEIFDRQVSLIFEVDDTTKPLSLKAMKKPVLTDKQVQQQMDEALKIFGGGRVVS